MQTSRAARWLLSLSALLLAASCGEPTAPPVATTIELSVPGTDLVYGTTGSATATVKDQRGAAMTGVTVVWSSANTAIVDVSSSGLLTPVGVGKAAITATVSGVSSSKDITVLPKTVAITATDSSLAPFAPLTIDVGEVIPNLAQATILGVRGTDTLAFTATSAQRVETIVVGLDEGSSPMKVVLGPNHVATLPLTISAPPTVTNPQAVVEDVRRVVDSTVASLTAAVTANGGTAANASFAGALGTWFKQTMDTASASTKLALAQFLATYPELLPNAAAPSVGRVAFAESGICSGNAATLEEGLAVCGSRLNIGIAAIAGGAIATRTTCKTPNFFCLVALTTTFGAVAVTYDLAKEFHKLPGVVTDNFDAVLSEGSPMVIGMAASPAYAVANFAMISDKPYQLSATASYRSIVAADAPRSNFLGKAVANLTAFDETWQGLVSIVNGIPASVRSTLPILPAAVGKAPPQPAATKNAPIPLGSLTASNPSSTITVASKSDHAGNTTTVTLKSGLEADYSFDITYLSDIGAAKTTVSGKIRVQAELARVSGNEQVGVGGMALLQPLSVIVKNKLTGAPVAGAQVKWATTASSFGTLSTDAVTTATDGKANVNWVLGDVLTIQTTQASVAFADGTAIAGSPIAFTAKTGVEAYYQLILADGQPLPKSTTRDPSFAVSSLVKGWIELRKDSTWTLYQAESVQYHFDSQPRIEDTEFTGTFSIRGSTLYLKFMTENGEPECECEFPINIPKDTLVMDYKVLNDPETYEGPGEVVVWTFKRAVKPANPSASPADNGGKGVPKASPARAMRRLGPNIRSRR